MYTPTGPFYSVPFDRGELFAVLKSDTDARLAELTTRPLQPGTKSIIRLIDDLVEVYARHSTTAPSDLPDYVIKVLDVLLVALQLLELLNPPGPA